MSLFIQNKLKPFHESKYFLPYGEQLSKSLHSQNFAGKDLFSVTLFGG